MTSRSNPDPLHCFAVTAPGLEPLAAAELRALGAADAAAEAGGVAFTAGPELLYTANLALRTASRILVRAAEFRATNFHELATRAAKVAWERWLPPGRPLALRVTCRKSRLYHSGAVAQRVAEAVATRLGAPTIADADAGDDDEGEGEHAQLVVVRLLHDRCTISIDASGALLHRRGYRQATAKAPLRETLAAAMLLASGWDGAHPLADPMCGSGTIAIEGALLARRIAPGLALGAPRDFACLAWPDADRRLWSRVVARARDAVLPAAPAPILASDRDAGAVAATRANAERAGVLADLALEQRPLSAFLPPDESRPGWLVSNPPYGVRVGERERLRDLYAAIGRLTRERLPGWTIALVTADRMLEGQVGLPLEERLATRNGGIAVRLMVATETGSARAS